MAVSVPDSTLAALEKLEAQLPPHLARRDLAELAVLMRYAERGAWAFAVYNTVPVRDEVAGVLRTLLSPLPVYEFTLSPQRPNPLDFLNEIPAGQGRAILFFFDLERTDGAVWRHLEMQRENLAARPLSLVFWIDRQAWREGVRAAPNFWSQRSGVFDFTIESPAVLTEVRGVWAGQPVWVEGTEDWERQMRLFSGLLREYEAEGSPPAARAELHGKIAYLLRFAGQNDEAAEHLQQQLTLAQAAADRRQQAQVMNNLGRVAQIQRGHLAALDWYERALTTAGDDPRARAESLQNVATVLVWEGEADRAEEMLQEALALFRAVGARLGEANTLRAIGDVQQFRDEREAALESYGQALALFRAVGDRLGEANTLRAIGDVQQFRKEIEAALESYGQALALFRAVGDRLGEANTLLSMARLEAELEAARAEFEQALSLYQAIGDLYSIARGLYYYALYLLEYGQKAEAVPLLERSAAMFEERGLPQIATTVRAAIPS
jgi:tetratricopeptide (TPR) repeat protein